MRTLILLSLAFLPIPLSSCSPVEALNAITPVANLRVVEGIEYGDQPSQTLDIYAPQHAQDAPVVVFIPGGGWTSANKEEYKFVGASLARAGYVTAVIEYRLAPQHRYPDFILDAAKAIAWMRAYATRYGGDPSEVFVMGHSAGAFNALEVVLNERFFAQAGVPIESVSGVIGLAGPYDYDFRDSPHRNAFPENALPENVLPTRHVRDDPPPTLLIVAGEDEVVSAGHAQKLAAAIQREGGQVRVVVLPDANHYTLIGALSTRISFLNPVRELVTEFINKHAEGQKR